MTNDQTSTLLRVADIAIGTGAGNLGALLGAEVEFSNPVILDRAPSIQDGEDQLIVVSVSFTNGIEGETALVFTDDEARRIIELMVVGMGIEEDDLLGELGMSALSEAMNQFVAGIGRGIGEMKGELVNISPPTVRLVASSDESVISPEDTSVLFWNGRLSGTDARLYWTITQDLIDALTGLATPETPNEPETSVPAEIEQQTPPSPISPEANPSALGRLADVHLDVTVELGRSHIPVRELLALDEGGVIRLGRPVGDPVDLLVNGLLTARGEIVVVDGRLGLRVTELI